MFETGHERGLKTEIAAQTEQGEARIGRDVGGDQLRAAITAAIIDEHGAPGEVGGLIENRAEPAEKLGQHLLFVEHGDDHGDDGQWGGRSHVCTGEGWVDADAAGGDFARMARISSSKRRTSSRSSRGTVARAATSSRSAAAQFLTFR